MTNLRDKKDYLSTIWDWTPFNECFTPTRIKITDIDGMVERNGLFLIIETKRPGVDIPKGQEIMFGHMIKTGLFTIVIVWGKTNVPQSALVMTRRGNIKKHSINIDGLKSIVRQWFNYANKSK